MNSINPLPPQNNPSKRKIYPFQKALFPCQSPRWPSALPQPGLEEAAQKLASSWEIWDNRRPRGSKGYRTAAELEAHLPHWNEKVEREAFVEQGCEAKERAVKGGGTAREKRQEERQAVYEKWEKFQLISTTRGGKPLMLEPEKPEDIL